MIRRTFQTVSLYACTLQAVTQTYTPKPCSSSGDMQQSSCGRPLDRKKAVLCVFVTAVVGRFQQVKGL
jgi:hypothetical protein